MSPGPSATLPPPRDPSGPYRVCLVCLGNICRSPMAETVLVAELELRGLGDAVQVDSAGTGDWHIGSRMDARARAGLTGRGYDGSAHVARQFKSSWLAERDLVLAMDRNNLADLQALAPDQYTAAERIRLFRSLGREPGPDAEVPMLYRAQATKQRPGRDPDALFSRDGGRAKV